jgi:carbamoyl-phosphate synthase large subunit
MIQNILITSAGQRVSLVKIFQTEIKRINPLNKVFTIDSNPDLSPACQISDGFKRVSRVSNSNFILELLEICRELQISIIIPTIDTELLLLSKNKHLFLAEGIVPIVSEFHFIEICRDKRETNKFFKNNGIEIPRNFDRSDLTFPLFLKPFDGSLSKDTFYIEDSSQLTNYHLENEKLMFMEYIDHNEHEEYTCDAYYDRLGILKCVVPRKRIFVRAGEVNKGVTRNNEFVKYIKEKLAIIEGAVGCITMQFFFNPDTKRIIGIEINPRFGGGFPLSYLAGANFPRFIIEEYILGKSIDFCEDWEANMLMLRYDNEVIIHNYCD